MIIFDANTPVDENTTKSFVVQVRNFFKWGMFDKDSVRRTLKVFEEDAHIVESLSPHYLPESLEEEVSVEQDKFMGAWRKVLRSHIERGWKINSKAMQNLEEERVFTIPSPARRSNPHLRWALETVPLLEGTDQPEPPENLVSLNS